MQLGVSLLLVLFNKLCHPHSHLFNHLPVKAVIKHSDDKLFREIEEMFEKCRNSAKLSKEDRDTE